jgi:hypothetical protein
MRTEKAIKVFDVRRGSVSPGGRYKIEVWFRGLLVDVFERQTMKEAEEALVREGYCSFIEERLQQ